MSNTKHTAKPLTNPAYQAHWIAKQLRRFRASTEEIALNNLDEDRINIIRLIDWTAYEQLINALEITHKRNQKSN